MFPRMSTKVKQSILKPYDMLKPAYDSNGFKKGLRLCSQKDTELMNARIPDSSKMRLTFNPIYIITYPNLTNNLKRIKTYFKDLLN